MAEKKELAVTEEKVVEIEMERPRKDGTYEIISGHRRKFAAEKIGYRTGGFLSAGLAVLPQKIIHNAFFQGIRWFEYAVLL